MEIEKFLAFLFGGKGWVIPTMFLGVFVVWVKIIRLESWMKVAINNQKEEVRELKEFIGEKIEHNNKILEREIKLMVHKELANFTYSHSLLNPTGNNPTSKKFLK